MKRLFDHDGNIATTFHYDELTEQVTLQRRQDVEPIIEHNKRLQTMNDGYSPSRELKRVASIPFTVFEGWLAADGLDWGRYWRMGRREQAAYRARKLSSSDWQYLRTV